MDGREHVQADRWIAALGLQPHVEGGYYRRYWQSERQAQGRPLGSAIYYLLRQGEVSAWHSIGSDELWLYHMGGSVDVTLLNADAPVRVTLGKGGGRRMSLAIKRGTVFGALAREGWTLLSCITFPAFVQEEHRLYSLDELLEMFGTDAHRAAILRLEGVGR